MFSTVTRTNTLKDQNDLQLLKRYQQDKDPASANELYSRYIHLIFHAALKYLKDKEKSRSLSLKIFNDLISIENPDSIKSMPNWLYTVVKNECISIDRKALAQHNRETEYESENLQEVYVENEAIQEQIVEEESNYKKLVRRSLKKLPEKQRVCVELFFMQDKSYKEIVRSTGYPESKVKSYLQNGKRRLRKLLDKSIYE